MNPIPSTEDNRTEFKQTLTDSLEKEVGAFLNYKEGGHLYIGIADDGTVIGISDPDKLQLQIVDRIKNNISPSTLGLFDIETLQHNTKSYLKITISSGPEKPYYLTKYGMTPRGCYLRVGSSVQQMSQAMIDEQYSGRTRNTLGLMISPIQTLTFAQLKIYYEERGYSVNDAFLRNLGLINRDGDYNYAAYLLADVNSISLKVARYAETDKIDLIENEEMGYCSLVKATLQILDKLEIANVTRTKITGKRRMEKRLIDPRALREAVVNAVVHNDYSRGIAPTVEIFSDRLMITSAGGLPQNLTEDEFFDGISAPRNQELMRIFRDLKLVEQLGSGMRRILEKYDKTIFTFSPNYLRVTFRYDDVLSEPLPVAAHETRNDTLPETRNETLPETRNETIPETRNETLPETRNETLPETRNETIPETRNETIPETRYETISSTGHKTTSSSNIRKSNTRKLILAVLKENPAATYQDIVSKTGRSRSTVSRALLDLQAEKKIIRIGAKKSGYWHVIQK